MEREKIITAVIIVCFFGGLVGGPIASLVDYYGLPEERFKLFIIPEIIGFVSAGFLVYYGKSRKNKSTDYKIIISYYAIFDPLGFIRHIQFGLQK